MIKKYLEFFINESLGEDNEYDVRQIFAELVQDMGFSISIEKKYFDEDMTKKSDSITNHFKKPVLFVSLNKTGDFEEADIAGLLPHIYECIDRLSEMGEIDFRLIETNLRKRPIE